MRVRASFSSRGLLCTASMRILRLRPTMLRNTIRLCECIHVHTYPRVDACLREWFRLRTHTRTSSALFFFFFFYLAVCLIFVGIYTLEDKLYVCAIFLEFSAVDEKFRCQAL
jgi:hypothetical protein